MAARSAGADSGSTLAGSGMREDSKALENASATGRQDFYTAILFTF
jgi:hypothetical protein